MDFILNTVSNSIGQKINYHQSLDENMDKLKRKYEELNGRKEDVESQMKAELQQGKRLKKEVALWLANVQKINDKKQNIENEVREGKYFKRASLGELTAKMIQEAEELYQRGCFSNGLVLDAPPGRGEIFPPTNIVGEATTIRKMEEIWNFLMNDETRLIGVYGIGGVGKTTVMQLINNRLLETTNNKFESVIWVNISKVLDVIRLQDSIAKAFNVDISGCEDETARAMKLFTNLSERKRYVLILDDVWEVFELKNVGIPEPSSANGCKLVLTTRSLDVCRNMNCKDVKMELLSKDEAWNLFLNIIGRDVLLTSSLEATMKLVAEECARLPLAIITIAGSMKGVVDECEWRNALRQLREVTRGLVDMEKVFEQLKYSYIRLKDDILRHCLLYCALYPEDFEIERKQLINYWIDERIIGGIWENSRLALFDEGHSILNKLENACLLEGVTKDYNKRYVKMHDLIRDMALQIMGRRYLVKAGVQLRDLPDEKKWSRKLQRVSLMNNCILEIRSGASPRCYRLSTLLLLGNGGLRRIPDSFFVFMGKLKVLDLSHTRIEILPNSISDLENLTALLLRWCCNLKYVPSLSKLRALEKLDLCGSGIEEVPEGMEMLINLRCLLLNMQYLNTLPAGILSKLCNLQCLIVWWGSKTLKVNGEEVAGLRKLETFAGQFHDLHEYNAYVKFVTNDQWMPQNYLLQVGPHGVFLDFDELGSYFSRYVGLKGCCISKEQGDPPFLPDNIKELEIKECHDAKSLCNVSTVHKIYRSLKYCKIIKCDGIECVLSCSSYKCTLHQSLEILQLEDLRRLRILFQGEAASPSLQSPLKTFSSLKELRIIKCSNIRKLFTDELLPNLENLEEIDVNNCSGMEEIIAATEQGMGESSSLSIVHNDDTIITITLAKLKRMTLEDLPELKSIVCNRAVLVCDSLQILTVLNCPKLERLPLYLPMLNGQPYPPPSLLQIEINDREWWESLEWNPPCAKDVLESSLLHIS